MHVPNPFPGELLWLFPRVKPQLTLHVASFLCLTLASLLALLTPLTFRWLIDSLLPAHNAHLLTIAIGLIFASYEGKAALSSLGGYFTFQATQRTALSLRISLLEHIDSLSADYFDRTPVGELLYPFEGPIDEISYFGSDLLPSILRTAISAGLTLSAMAVLHAPLTLVIVPIIPAFLALRHPERRRLAPQADLARATQTKLNASLHDPL